MSKIIVSRSISGIAETKGFEFDIVEPTESEKNVVYIKVIWKCDYIKCNAKLDSIINYFYKEQILGMAKKNYTFIN